MLKKIWEWLFPPKRRMLRKYWQDSQRLAPAVRQCAEDIKTVLNAEYLHSSSWKQARGMAQETLNQFRSVPPIDYLNRASDADFIQLQQIAQWSDQDVEEFHQLATAVRQCAEDIKTVLNAEYLRISSWKQARDMAQETLNRFCREPVMNYLNRATDADFIQLQQIAQWSDQDVEEFHQLATAVNQCTEEIKTVLNADAGYLRISSWRKVRALAQKILNQYESVVDSLKRTTHADFILLQQIVQLQQIAQWSNKDVEEFHQLATAVRQCAEDIKTVLNAEYLRISSWKQARDMAQETLNRFCREPVMNYLNRATDADFIQLQQIAQWSDQDVEEFHQLATAVRQCAEDIKTVLNAEYLRISSWRKVRALAQKILNQYESLVDSLKRTTHADFILLQKIVQLHQIAQWSDQDVKEFHQLAAAVDQCAEEIKTVLNAEYLHSSSWRKVRDLAQETLNQYEQPLVDMRSTIFMFIFFGWRETLNQYEQPLVDYLDRTTHADFILLQKIGQLQQIAQWSDQDVEEFHQLATAVNQCIEELNTGYLRSSRWQRVRDQAQDILNQYEPLVDYLNRTTDADFILLQQVAQLRKIVQWSDRDVEKFRQQYVNRYKKKFSAYFDRVESNPLTERQRDACVIDEDNNLVLGGAGTGKTSTMVGRAGFLLQSGQANPAQILLLAFARKAAEEMQQRLNQRVDVKGIVASTFHKLGKDIIAEVENRQPSISPLKDEKMLEKYVDQWFEEMLADPPYKQFVLNYFGDYLYETVNSFDFETKGEYFEYIRANDIRTLKGEEVKSLEECLIANHLFALGIEYKYEAPYQYPTHGPDFRQYKPDFYLPTYDIYIEHIGIDRDGGTAPFVDRKKYHQDLEWKHNIHEKHNTCLLKTYHYERMEGNLQQGLEQKLTEVGVKFDPLPPEKMLEALRKFGAVSAVAKLLAKLLQGCKRIGICPDQLQKEKFPHIDPDRLQRIRIILSPIYESYQRCLAEKQEIDFDDMIHKALTYVEDGHFVAPWRYILVDEFQDISAPRARLVKALQESAYECSLFCIGDDWQAIYRFTGSDIRFTTEFEAEFGPTKMTALDKTFRFNNSICEITSRFVLENPRQRPKTLTTHTTVQYPAVSLLRQKRPGKSDFDERLNRVLAQIDGQAQEGSNVYLLSRFRFNLPETAQMTALRKRFPALKIQPSTIHGSKGLEADYIVVLGLERGKNGFPSRKVDHPLLEALLPVPDSFPYAEERRLFYVALTRAKQRVYLISDMANASEFVVELLDNKYPLELGEFETDLAQKFFTLIRCMECKTGTMVAREGKNGAFYGCSHYPLCNHTEEGCPECGSPMQRIDGFKKCIHPDCESQVPICLKCDAEMVRRQGIYGEFWGCTNYRGNGEISCRYTKNIPTGHDPKSLSAEQGRSTWQRLSAVDTAILSTTTGQDAQETEPSGPDPVTVPYIWTTRHRQQQEAQEKELSGLDLLDLYYQGVTQPDQFDAQETELNGPNPLEEPKDMAIGELRPVNHKQEQVLTAHAPWQSLLTRQDVLILDTETTGFSKMDLIVDIAIIDTTGVVRFDSLVGVPAGTNINPKAVRIHGLDQRTLKDAPAWPEIHDEIMKQLTGAAMVCCWNTPFDRRLLRQTVAYHGLTMPKGIQWRDLLRDHRQLKPNADRHGLEAVSSRYGIRTEGSHRALPDCLTILKVLTHVTQMERQVA